MSVSPTPELVSELQARTLARLELEEPLDTLLPSVARDVYMLAADPETPMSAVAQVIAKDPAMSARVVSMANSAYYRRAIEIDSVTAAVLRLGLEGVRNMVILPRIRAKLERDPLSEKLWRHACGVAVTSQFIARRAKIGAETAYLAGLLHDMGRMVLWREARNLSAQPSEPVLEEAMNQLHESVGEILLARWSLPEVIVFAAGWHHNPPPIATTPSERMAHVVALANMLVEAVEGSSEPDPQCLHSSEVLEISEAQLDEVWRLVPEILLQSIA
jgi:HD-like signal output (HDOD) protein